MARQERGRRPGRASRWGQSRAEPGRPSREGSGKAPGRREKGWGHTEPGSLLYAPTPARKKKICPCG